MHVRYIWVCSRTKNTITERPQLHVCVCVFGLMVHRSLTTWIRIYFWDLARVSVVFRTHKKCMKYVARCYHRQRSILARHDELVPQSVAAFELDTHAHIHVQWSNVSYPGTCPLRMYICVWITMLAHLNDGYEKIYIYTLYRCVCIRNSYYYISTNECIRTTTHTHKHTFTDADTISCILYRVCNITSRLPDTARHKYTALCAATDEPRTHAGGWRRRRQRRQRRRSGTSSWVHKTGEYELRSRVYT